MAKTLHIEIDINQVLRLTNSLSPDAMQKAWRRTLRKTANWVKSQTAKAVSKKSHIPQKVLRQRINFFLRSRDTGKVWLGLNAIEADRLGTPRQTRTGVTVARNQFKSAWIYRSSDANTGKVFRRKGKARTPYERVKFDWDQEGAAAFREAAARAEERLLIILRQEVSYELQKAIAGAR